MSNIEEIIKNELDFCKSIDCEKNEHGQFIYTSKNGASSMNLPYVLQEYKEWLISKKNRKAIMKAPEQWVLTQIGGGVPPKNIGQPYNSVIAVQTEKKRLASQPQYKQFTLVVRRKVAFEKCPVMQKHFKLNIKMEKFKKFWVVIVNNYICDASYNGNELKEKHPFPSFRKFHFIKSWDELKYFTKRDEITNEDLVKRCLLSQ